MVSFKCLLFPFSWHSRNVHEISNAEWSLNEKQSPFGLKQQNYQAEELIKRGEISVLSSPPLCWENTVQQHHSEKCCLFLLLLLGNCYQICSPFSFLPISCTVAGTTISVESRTSFCSSFSFVSGLFPSFLSPLCSVSYACTSKRLIAGSVSEGVFQIVTQLLLWQHYILTFKMMCMMLHNGHYWTFMHI